MTIRGFFSDWRKILIYTHRWLGIVWCLIFIVWFVSGIAMLYWQMPRLTAEERLMRMSILDLSSDSVSAAQAAANAHISPSRVRILPCSTIAPCTAFLTALNGLLCTQTLEKSCQRSARTTRWR